MTLVAKAGASSPWTLSLGGCESGRDRNDIDVTEKKAGRGQGQELQVTAAGTGNTQAGKEVAVVSPAKQVLKPRAWHLPAWRQGAVPRSSRSQERRPGRVGWERQGAGSCGSSSLKLPSWMPTHRAGWRWDDGRARATVPTNAAMWDCFEGCTLPLCLYMTSPPRPRTCHHQHRSLVPPVGLGAALVCCHPPWLL